MNRIAELRKKNGLSQTELANKLNIAQNTLSQYENEIRTPSSRIILFLSDLFEVTPNYLMGDPDPQAPKQDNLFSVTKILQESNVNRVNLYLRKGWRLLSIDESKERYHDSTERSDIIYTLGWTDNPSLAQELPPDYSNEDESVHNRFYKLCNDIQSGEEIAVFYDDPNNPPPDSADFS